MANESKSQQKALKLRVAGNSPSERREKLRQKRLQAARVRPDDEPVVVA